MTLNGKQSLHYNTIKLITNCNLCYIQPEYDRKIYIHLPPTEVLYPSDLMDDLIGKQV